jgi:VIT1/CCC1 family predicted Fe2+/Mn2+ transporter
MPVPEDMPDDDWHTPVGMPVMEEIAFRAKRTQHDTTKAVNVSQDTLDRVEIVRAEMKAELQQTRLDMSMLRTQQDTIMRVLLEERQERKDRAHLRTKAESSEIDLEKAKALAQSEIYKTRAIELLKDGSLTHEFQRKILYRAIYTIFAAAFALLTYMLGKRG